MSGLAIEVVKKAVKVKQLKKSAKPLAAPKHLPFKILVKEVGSFATFFHCRSSILVPSIPPARKRAQLPHLTFNVIAPSLQALVNMKDRGGSSIVALRKAICECKPTQR